MLLNYIWAGLIIIALVFALTADTMDLVQDRYRAGQALPVELEFPDGYDPAERRQPVLVHIDQAAYQAFYDTEEVPDTTYAATMTMVEGQRHIRFAADAVLPEPLATIRDVVDPRENRLQGVVHERIGEDIEAMATGILFEPIHFVNMNNIAQAALDFATTAAEIAIGLIGILALFLGLLKIGEEAGVIRAMTRFVRPALKPLFPQIPDDHPAFSVIALNMAANIFGLGNAATPFGIKAMEELQTLNPTDDTATDPMVMLLAVNTASVQLVPPVLLMALMGLLINQLIFAIIITTGISLIVAITAAKLLGRLEGFRKSDPNVTHAPATDENSAGDDPAG